MNPANHSSPIWSRMPPKIAFSAASVLVLAASLTAGAPISEPVVARVEMKLTEGEEVVDVIEQGDLLTVVEERESDYVIVTHDGKQGAVSKVNAVKIAESGDIYTDLIQRNPEVGRYYTLRASSWWALGKADKALEDFDRAIDLGYAEAHAFISRGLFHASLGNYDKAIADYDRAIEVDPKDTAPLINRATAYMMKSAFDKAIEDYTVAIDRQPKRTSLLHQRAIAHKAAGNMEQAAADFTKILEINENDITAVMGRGYVHFQNGDNEAAINDFGKATELNPKDPVAYNNRGYNLSEMGRFAEALKDYDKALELAPKYALALQNRAWLLATADDIQLRDPASAVESAKLACELTNYESIEDLSALAAALAADGKFDEAVGWQEKVVKMVDKPYKSYADKLLQRYQQERPFAIDPDAANAQEKAQAEQEAKERQEAKSAQDQSAAAVSDSDV